MVKAFVLVQAEVGRGAHVARMAEQIGGLRLVDVVTGPYDVIARAEAEDMDELGAKVLRPLQQIEGVIRTMTCPILHG
jgi:DNA-binding Lrp family transcriptional regulator